MAAHVADEVAHARSHAGVGVDQQFADVRVDGGPERERSTEASLQEGREEEEEEEEEEEQFYSQREREKERERDEREKESFACAMRPHLIAPPLPSIVLPSFALPHLEMAS